MSEQPGRFIINRRRVVEQKLYVIAATYAEALALAKLPPIETEYLSRREATVQSGDEVTLATTYRSNGREQRT